MNTDPAHSTLRNRARGSRVWMMRCSGAYSLETVTAVSRSGTRITRQWAMDSLTILMRLSSGTCFATSSPTARANSRDVVTSTTCAMVSCSACASRSAATKVGLALSSAMTSTSEGPAGRSMAAPSGSPATICLAADPGAAGAENLVHLCDGFGAEGERRDGLRSTHLVDHLDAAQLGGHQHGGV